MSASWISILNLNNGRIRDTEELSPETAVFTDEDHETCFFCSERLHFRTRDLDEKRIRICRKKKKRRRSGQIAPPLPEGAEISELDHRPHDIGAGGRRDPDALGQLPERAWPIRLTGETEKNPVKALQNLNHATSPLSTVQRRKCFSAMARKSLLSS